MVDGLGRFSCSLFMMHTFFIYCLNIPICLINKERHRRCPYAKSLEQERKREERFGIVRFLRSSEQATSGSRSIFVFGKTIQEIHTYFFYDYGNGYI